jgi:hypothetical protein
VDDRRIIGLRGCERSGTNLLQHWLMGEHFPRINVDPRSKHHTRLDNNIPREIILITKHPFAWSVSFWRLVHRSAASIPWLRQVKVGCDYDWFVKTNGATQWWCQFQRHWTRDIYKYPHGSRQQWRILHIRYEEILYHTQAVIHRVAGWLGVPPPSAAHMKKLPVNRYHVQTEDMRTFDITYYTQERWREVIDTESWRILDQGMDWPLAEQLGYERPVQ